MDQPPSFEGQSANISFTPTGKCWWCGETADSREHKYKKSDLVRLYGRGQWSGADAVSLGGHTNVRGPKASAVKFLPVLCQRCNNDRSQAFDHAYSIFAEFLDTDFANILPNGRFRWSDVFGPEWRSYVRNLVCYWFKHIACRLAELGLEVPQGLVAYLNDGETPWPPTVFMYLEGRLDIASMMIHSHSAHSAPNGGLWLGDIFYRDSPNGSIEEFWSHYTYTWIRLVYGIAPSLAIDTSPFGDDEVVLTYDFSIHPDEVAAKCETCTAGIVPAQGQSEGELYGPAQ